MYRTIIIAAALSVFISSETLAQPESATRADNKAAAPTITVTRLDMNEKALNLVYEIRNDSEQDVWILVGWHQLSDHTFGMGAGVRIAEDGHTLTIRARFETPKTGVGYQPVYGRFVRLHPGDSQTESIFMRLPAYLRPQFGHVGQQEQDVKYATRLAIDVGYYRGNLPERILKTLKLPENVFPVDPNNPPVSPRAFNWLNEYLNSRDDELLIWEDFREFKSEDEQVIRTVIENLNIPYEEISAHDVRRHVRYDLPDLTSCTKVEIKYRPSILNYFFPFAFQQSLLSSEELDYLRSDKILITEDAKKIKAFANDISKATTRVTYGGALIERYRNHVDVICSYDSKPPMSFFIYNDDALRIDSDVLPCSEGFPSLKMLTPKIQAIDLRTRCANNLKNHWYRFRFYNMHEALRQNDPSIRNQTLYPTPFEWCDYILRPYYDLGGITIGRLNPKPHICPSAGEGKNHYAMNPNCKYESPPDTLLLFETKAGWNQHGGPELFTFDNHNPKGGCILLNDGTVKFIRTKEELRQLRW